MTKYLLVAIATMTLVNSAQATVDLNCEEPQTQVEMNMCAGQDATYAKEDLATTLEDARRDLHTAIDRSTDDMWQIPRLREALALVNSMKSEQTSTRFDEEANEIVETAPLYEKWALFKCQSGSMGSYGGSIRSLEISTCMADFYRAEAQKVSQMVREAIAF